MTLCWLRPPRTRGCTGGYTRVGAAGLACKRGGPHLPPSLTQGLLFASAARLASFRGSLPSPSHLTVRAQAVDAAATSVFMCVWGILAESHTPAWQALPTELPPQTMLLALPCGVCQALSNPFMCL